jgi:hypothetical protein
MELSREHLDPVTGLQVSSGEHTMANNKVPSAELLAIHEPLDEGSMASSRERLDLANSMSET